MEETYKNMQNKIKRAKITLENKIKIWSKREKLEDVSKMKWTKKKIHTKVISEAKTHRGDRMARGQCCIKRIRTFYKQHIQCVHDKAMLLLEVNNSHWAHTNRGAGRSKQKCNPCFVLQTPHLQLVPKSLHCVIKTTRINWKSPEENKKNN